MVDLKQKNSVKKRGESCNDSVPLLQQNLHIQKLVCTDTVKILATWTVAGRNYSVRICVMCRKSNGSRMKKR